VLAREETAVPWSKRRLLDSGLAPMRSFNFKVNQAEPARAINNVPSLRRPHRQGLRQQPPSHCAVEVCHALRNAANFIDIKEHDGFSLISSVSAPLASARAYQRAVMDFMRVKLVRWQRLRLHGTGNDFFYVYKARSVPGGERLAYCWEQCGALLA
jgi:hypothetical protein